MLAAIPSRFLLAILRSTQPLLIVVTIDYVHTRQHGLSETSPASLMTLAVVSYIDIAVGALNQFNVDPN